MLLHSHFRWSSASGPCIMRVEGSEQSGSGSGSGSLTVSESKIRVFCVEDDPATSRYYQLALRDEPDLEFVGAQESTDGLLEKVDSLRPHVALLDLLIPGCEPLDTLSELRARHPELVVVVVSGLDDPRVVE